MNSTTFSTRLCALLFILLFSSVALGSATKVDLCHIPPGDPENFHTITISVKAYDSHMKHGDLEGACDEVDPEPEVSCPCFDSTTVEGLTASCIGNANEEVNFYVGFTACSGDGSVFPCTAGATSSTPGCGLYFEDGSGLSIENLSAEENDLCKSILLDSCNA